TEPVFKETGDFFDIEFIRGNDSASMEEVKDIGITQSPTIVGQIEKDLLTERQQAVLSLLEIDPTISRQEIVASLGINASAVQKHLAKLKELGIIERVGGTRGYWQ